MRTKFNWFSEYSVTKLQLSLFGTKIICINLLISEKHICSQFLSLRVPLIFIESSLLFYLENSKSRNNFLSTIYSQFFSCPVDTANLISDFPPFYDIIFGKHHVIGSCSLQQEITMVICGRNANQTPSLSSTAFQSYNEHALKTLAGNPNFNYEKVLRANMYTFRFVHRSLRLLRSIGEKMQENGCQEINY